MKEHLARIHMKDGKTIDVHREDGNVLIASEDHKVVLPLATGQQTLGWIALFEDLAERIEYPEGPDEGV
ncbi:hypothetical protein LCGC14_0541200 [marine sediment metagenome]|uniref:Uncharacterized protein n=1 Tax=marine sediment metagenome TaxID=412755 RepID=A0A0F9UE38_9ZZZZ